MPPILAPLPGATLDVDEHADEITISIRGDATPDRALDLAFAVAVWLEVAGWVALARAGADALGRAAPLREGPWIAVAIALLALGALAVVLGHARAARSEREVLRSDSRTLWREVHGRLASRTESYPVESIRALGVMDPPGGRWAAALARWWPVPRLSFQLGARPVRFGRGLDDDAASEVLERLAPWIERADGAHGRTRPHGPNLAPTTAPELGAGAVRCARCGAEHVIAADPASLPEPAIAWCDGCAAWVELARERELDGPQPTGARLAATAHGAESVLDLPASASLATRLAARMRRLAFPVVCLAVLGAVAMASGATLGRAVTMAGRVALLAAVLAALARLVLWVALPLPPHRIRLRRDGLRIEWRHGPLVRSAALGYERTTSIAAIAPRRRGRTVPPADRWRVCIRSGPRVVAIASWLTAEGAARLAQAIRDAAAHAAWRWGRMPGWVPRHELACPACRAPLDERPGPPGEPVEAVVCERCERTWSVAEALSASLGRMEIDSPPGDDLAITTSPVHGAIVTVRAEPLGRRLRRLVPGLVCVAGAYGLHRATAVTHIGQLRVLAWTSAALGVVWLARAVAAASTRAIEIRVNHDTLTLRRVRALGSTARRVPIERVEAVERRRRAPRADDPAERPAAVRLRLRRAFALPLLAHARVRLGAHLDAAEQRWLATVLDRIVFETAFPEPRTPTAGVPADAEARIAAEEPAPLDSAADGPAESEPAESTGAVDAHGSDTSSRRVAM
ncbi:MAG: hypothetical protein U0610_13930 [bacterium]